MEKSHWLSLITEDLAPTAEVLLTNPNVPSIEQAAVLGIMNNYGSDTVVRIKEIQVNEIIARTTTALTNLDLYRITALTGGTVITPIKHDSSSSLPSQVQIVKYPNTVTTSGSYLRRGLSWTGLTATSLLGLMTARGGTCCGVGSGGMNLNHVFSSNDSNVQPFVLREGEGIAVKTSLVAPLNYGIEVTAHFSDGTNTFAINEIINVQSATELFAIFNGIGSGVVLYLSRLEMRIIRTSDIYRYFTIESCSGIYYGQTITTMAMDSANGTIDTQVQFKKNCVIRQGNTDSNFGRNARAGGDTIPFRRLVEPAFGKGVALANGALQLRPISNKPLAIDKANNIGEIVLREGEGIAILQRFNFAIWGNYEFNILFTVVDSGGAVTGGECSYVF